MNIDSKINSNNAEIQKAQLYIKELALLNNKIALVNNTFEYEKSIHNELKKLGLEIGRISISTSGREIGSTLKADKNVYIEANLVKTENSKFKFVPFKGYDKSGSGKNRKQLENKCSKLEEKLSSENFTASINVFSLEDDETNWRSSSNENRVMITWRLKN